MDELAKRIFAIAYQMTGSVVEAEDIRQEILLSYWEGEKEGKWAEIANHEAFWVRATTNRTLNHLKKKGRETYPGEWLPEPIYDVASRADTQLDISYGFVHLLSKLTPGERAVFILRESFDFPFKEIGETLEITEDNARKMYQRAKLHLHSQEKPQAIDPEGQKRLVEAFMQAIGLGSLDLLKTVLKEDVVTWSDGGGKRKAALKPIAGLLNTFKFLVGLGQKNAADGIEFAYDLRTNGREWQLSLFNLSTQEMDTVVSFDMEGEMIGNIYLQRNPDKLDQWKAIEE